MTGLGKLTFDEAEHVYTLDGRGVPAVSDVLEPLQTLEGIPASVLAEARERGRAVHHACALMVQQQLEWRTLDPSIVGYVSAAKLALEELGIKVLSCEYRMACPTLKFAGTLDIMGIMEKRQVIIDWKAVATMSRTVGLQTAAYDYLFRRNFGGRSLQRFGIQLFPDSDENGRPRYKCFEYSDTRDWNWFASALNIYHWKNA